MVRWLGGVDADYPYTLDGFSRVTSVPNPMSSFSIPVFPSLAEGKAGRSRGVSSSDMIVQRRMSRGLLEIQKPYLFALRSDYKGSY